MRPGPGLVVMALAFISGARRGSSTSQKQQQEEQQQQQYDKDIDIHQTILPNIYYNSNNYNHIIKNNIEHNYLLHTKLGKIGHGDDEGTGALARVNPWLSACDLAQPNQSDLLGQCSAGTLPVAWVDEGPGPPKCPKSCEQLNLEQNNKYITDNKYNNINLNNYNNYENNNNFNTMDNLNNVRQQKPQRQQETMHAHKQHQQSHHQQQQQQQQQKTQKQQQQQQQQCLDYLGDNEESSPSQLCNKSRSELATKLRSLRLKHCCERNVFSALHTLALNATLNGGGECVRTLNDILDMDTLATRITCEFTEILVRYDCRQIYSLIHHCEDCKEAYRRWVCSTLIPYFAEPADIRQNLRTSNSIVKTKLHSAKNNYVRSTRSIESDNSDVNDVNGIKSDREVNGNSDKSHSISTAIGDPIVQDPVIERLLKRSKRKVVYRRRRRIRPCLSVCQTVEQKCPYFLPGDRAPAYPTQYAGEPTFLCLDPNMPETGEQFRKSTNGPENCCYRYCDTPAEGICAYCDDFRNKTDSVLDNSNINNRTENLSTTTSTTSSLHQSIHNDILDRIINVDNIYYFDDSDDSIVDQSSTGICQNFHGTTSTTSSNRCTIPYYASSSTKLGTILLSYRYLIIWTTLWCLVNNIITISNWTKILLLIHGVWL